MRTPKPHLSPGDRIRVTSCPKDKNIKAGMEGTVHDISWGYKEWQVWIKFDNGALLALLQGIDTWEVL